MTGFAAGLSADGMGELVALVEERLVALREELESLETVEA